MPTRPKEKEPEASDSSLEIPLCAVPVSHGKQSKDQDLSANTILGVKGMIGQYLQSGAIGALIIAFGFAMFWLRSDARTIVHEMMSQMSVERAEDRELRKEIADNNMKATQMLSSSIRGLQTEIKASDDKSTRNAEKIGVALDKLSEKIDKMR